MWTLCPADVVINDRPATGHRRLGGRRGMAECPSSLGRRAAPAVFPADVRVLQMPTSPGALQLPQEIEEILPQEAPLEGSGWGNRKGNQPYIIHGQYKSEGVTS